jgi:hypothetical protein
MSLSAKLPKMALQPFEPEPHTVYTIETAAHFAQAVAPHGRRLLQARFDIAGG